MLYQLNEPKAVPNWFGVAVPDGVTDFTKPVLYFHPTPNQGPYSDADYRDKKSSPGHRDWKELFEYVDRLGHQLAGAVQVGATPDQIVILPFMKTSLSGDDIAVLPNNWLPILTDILADVRSAVTGSGGPLAVSEMVVASFSNGFTYSESFRSTAVGLGALLKQVWDFDGFPKSSSNALVSTPGVKAIKYDQGAETGSLHLPHSRWADFPQPPPDEEPGLPRELNPNGTVNDSSYVHHLIRDFMYLDAATRRL